MGKDCLSACMAAVLLAVSCNYMEKGSFRVSEDDFATVYSMTGTPVCSCLPGTGNIYKVWQSGREVIAADTGTGKLHVFSFPGFEPVDEIEMPYSISSEGMDFFQTDDRESLCGIRSRIGGRIDRLLADHTLQCTDQGAVYAMPYNSVRYNDLLPVSMDRKDFWFSSVDMENGNDMRALYRIRRGTAAAEKLYSLQLPDYPGYDMKFFPWGTSLRYMHGRRVVYAYEQFKALRFMESDGDGERLLDFFRYRTVSQEKRQWKYIQGYYRGQIFAGRHRLYVSSYEYGSGNLSRLYNEMPFQPFTVVEVYSFSGEPVEIYRLDREGHVIVDESDRMLYLIETDGGVFSYRMP